MADMDIFRQDAFSMIEMTNAVRNIQTEPSFIGSLNIFTPKPIITERFSIEMVGDGLLGIVATSERGAPRPTIGRNRRTMRDFSTVRIRETDKIRAAEVQGIRAFGSQTEVQAVQAVVTERMGELVRRNELTHEFHRLGAIQGIVTDADTSVIRNFYTEFGIAEPGEIAFDLATRTRVNEFLKQNVIRPMRRALGGRWTTNAKIIALCGDAFYDSLIENPEVRTSYLNWQAAQELRGDAGKAFESFRFGNIEWINYQGTDDNSTVAINVDKVRFLPVGIPDVFQTVYSPGESIEMVGTMGQPRYARQVPDPSGYNEFVELDVASYPLHMCLAPQALLKGRRGA